MALTGELSDLSLAELIEFFCNQRKTGRLKVVYSDGPGYFYLQAGSVVHARIGVLGGIEAVYYALTLPNASFTFSPAFEPPEHTINQPWTSVVLEGLRRMDEGVQPQEPSFEQDHPADHAHFTDVDGNDSERKTFGENKKDDLLSEILSPPEVEAMGAFLSQSQPESHWLRGPWKLAAIAAAVVLIVAVIGVPWGWYAHSKTAQLAAAPKSLAPSETQTSTASTPASQPEVSAAPNVTSQPVVNSDAELMAKKQREERARER